MEEKLEKCPFCKSSATHLMTHSYGIHDEEVEYYIVCNKCEIESPTFETKQEAIDYWNNGVFRDKKDSAKVGYDIKNLYSFCTYCGNPLDDVSNNYCPVCGKKLVYDMKKEQEIVDENDRRNVHPYGWPLTKEELLSSIGKPAYINSSEDYIWKIINKIEINTNGFNINASDSSWYKFEDVSIYDPCEIIKKNLYPTQKKEEEKTISKLSIGGTEYKFKCDCCNK